MLGGTARRLKAVAQPIQPRGKRLALGGREAADAVLALLIAQSLELQEGDKIDEGIDVAPHLRDDDDLGPLPAASQQIPLRAAIDTADQRHLVAWQAIEPLDGEEGVLLRATQNHARDDVKHARRRGPLG